MQVREPWGVAHEGEYEENKLPLGTSNPIPRMPGAEFGQVVLCERTRESTFHNTNKNNRHVVGMEVLYLMLEHGMIAWG